MKRRIERAQDEELQEKRLRQWQSRANVNVNVNGNCRFLAGVEVAGKAGQSTEGRASVTERDMEHRGTRKRKRRRVGKEEMERTRAGVKKRVDSVARMKMELGDPKNGLSNRHDTAKERWGDAFPKLQLGAPWNS